MTTAHLLAIFVPLAYILGSIPFGLLVGLANGVDPRAAGSRNIGATNVGRLLGTRFFWVVFILDLLKGFIPTVLAGKALGFAPATAGGYGAWLLVAAAAVLGHMFSCFLHFKGGKGVSTAAGIILGVWPYYTLPGILAILVFVLVLRTTRFVSLGSILGTIAFALFYILCGLAMHWPLFGAQLPLLIGAILLAALIVYKHRANIARLRAGTELRAGASNPARPEASR